MLTYIASIVSGIQVRVIIDKNIGSMEESVYTKLTELIINLPHWFDRACFSLVNQKPIDINILDEFCHILAEKRSTFIFKTIELKGWGNQPEVARISDFSFAYLIAHSLEIVLWTTYLDLRCYEEALEERCYLRELNLHASSFYPPV